MDVFCEHNVLVLSLFSAGCRDDMLCLFGIDNQNDAEC